MPRDEMRGENRQDELWRMIQARREAGAEHETAPPIPGTDDLDTDAVLIDVLYQAVRTSEPQHETDGSYARAQLQSAIATDLATGKSRPTSEHVPYVSDHAVARVEARNTRSGFWQMAGRRQLILAIALLLITAAAIAFVVWSARPRVCSTADPDSPAAPIAVSASLASPVPMQVKSATRNTASAHSLHKCK